MKKSINILEVVKSLTPEIGLVSEFVGKIHKVAKLNPMMGKDEIEALKNDLKENSQLLPIYIFRGYIIDGRNRIKALSELGVENVDFIKLPHKTLTEDLMILASATERRRQQDQTQLGIKAYRANIESGVSLKSAAESVGVSWNTAKLAKQLAGMRPKIVDSLFNIDYDYVTSYGSTTRSLNAIIADVKKIDEEKDPMGDNESDGSGDIETAKNISFVEKQIEACEIMMSNDELDFALEAVLNRRAMKSMERDGIDIKFKRDLEKLTLNKKDK